MSRAGAEGARERWHSPAPNDGNGVPPPLSHSSSQAWGAGASPLYRRGKQHFYPERSSSLEQRCPGDAGWDVLRVHAQRDLSALCAGG